MKIAIPTENGRLCAHFGHSPQFTLVDVNADTGLIENRSTMTPPPHDRGVLPAWLRELGCTHIIAGGMGGRALTLFAQQGIEVVCGVGESDIDDIIAAFFAGTLATDNNPCSDPSFHAGGHTDCEHRH